MRVAFFGTPHFAVATLEALLDSRHQVACVVAQPDKPSGRGMRMQKPPVAAVAVERGLPLMQPAKINAEFLAELARFNVSLGVVVAYGKILPEKLISIPQHGMINVHGSLLPKWRGAAPVQRSIEAGERETGVTIMRIDRELDHGAMFAKAFVGIAPDERAPSVFARLATAGAALLVDVVDAIERGDAREEEQQHELATYAKKMEKDEGRIRWEQPARAIYDRFRAFDPWPGTFFEHAGEVVKVHEMRPGDERAAPGEVLSVGETVVVGTGDGALELVTLQRPGKPRASARDVSRGLSIHAGTHLS